MIVCVISLDNYYWDHTVLCVSGVHLLYVCTKVCLGRPIVQRHYVLVMQTIKSYWFNYFRMLNLFYCFFYLRWVGDCWRQVQVYLSHLYFKLMSTEPNGSFAIRPPGRRDGRPHPGARNEPSRLSHVPSQAHKHTGSGKTKRHSRTYNLS